MSDRYSHLTVVLDDIVEPHMLKIVDALKLMHGVRDVIDHKIDAGYYIARDNARLDLVDLIWTALLRKPEKP